MYLLLLISLAIIANAISREIDLRHLPAEPVTAACPNCSARIESGWLACPRCSSLLRTTCNGCGRHHDRWGQFCPWCGQANGNHHV